MTRLPPFDRHSPGTVAEAAELLERLGDDAVVYAGGTELFLLFKFGFADYPHLVNLKGIAELRGIERRDGWLRIGAAETHRRIERDPLVREGWPALAAMERGVGNLRVRTMGTIGGNLCFADPHSDPTTFLLAAGGVLEAQRGEGPARQIEIGDFVRGPFENTLEGGELLTGVLVPEPVPNSALVHRKFILHERPAITVACHLRVDGGRLGEVRLAVGSAGIMAARATAAESLLEGADVDELQALLEQTAPLAAEAAAPVEDANGSVDYKTHMIGVLSARSVRAAVAAAGAGPSG